MGSIDFIFDDSLNISSRKARTLTFLTDLRKDMAAAAPNRFNPGGFRGVRKPPTAEEWEKFSDYEKDEKRGEEWMNRVYGWNINAENEKVSSDRWLPDKLLGKGVAVFKKGHTTDTGDVFYKRIVVKQASSPEAKSRLQNGASILDHLRAYWVTDADHLVLPFGAYEEDAGTGTDDTFDPVYFHESTSDALGKFEKAAIVPSDPMDKTWMFNIRGRADPKWATPEQKYPHMEGRSIGTSCNIFGIGALLYYMITGRELGDSAWNIGISDSPADQGLKLYFGADLITEPIAKQQEYSKTLIRTILQCLSYHPGDRIDAKELLELSTKALNFDDRQRMPKEVRYNPGDPVIILEPQEELQPNDYIPSDLSLKIYNPPADQPETLRAKAGKWLNRFFLFPDSAKGQRSREKQRLEYETQVEIKRKAEATRKRLLAEIEADEAEQMRLQIEEEEEEDRKAAERRAKKRTELAAEITRRRAAATGEGGQQELLPQPVRKRDRSPEIVDERSRKRARSKSPVRPNTPDTAAAEKGGAEPMDSDVNKDKKMSPSGDLDKVKEKEVKEKEAKEKEAKEKEAKEKEAKEKEKKAEADELERQREYHGKLGQQVEADRRENERKKQHAKAQWTHGASSLDVQRQNPRLDPHLYINPNYMVLYKGSNYRVKDLLKLKEPFPWKDFAWWDSILYLKESLPRVAIEYYEDLKERGVELVAHSGTLEETSLEWENVSRMIQRFDKEGREKEREKEREENGHLGLINPPVGGAARRMNDNHQSPGIPKFRDYLAGLTTNSPNYRERYNQMGPRDFDDDEDPDDSVQEVPAPPANDRYRAPPIDLSRFMVVVPPKAPRAPRAPRAPPAKITAWFCPYCNDKDGGYAKKGSCETHIKTKHKNRKGNPKTTAFVPRRVAPKAKAPERPFDPYRYQA
ncbi:hypothetical protein BcDW1_4388 [Botrytis cinerea BcDW1]|uniref:Protein kinase domain-containing protein n=1 Tax=Botryotinia fuckeliana (strain BcDW1) TaxID=1290391 RepID=M7UT60_BOTF1|nr:hypothetical protein BcDW1_4388 [Botrytis cinerea BcDW1]